MLLEGPVLVYGLCGFYQGAVGCAFLCPVGCAVCHHSFVTHRTNLTATIGLDLLLDSGKQVVARYQCR